MRGKASKLGDTRISPNGYHYTRTADKWELTGRLVMEELLGRPLKPNERIRYIDGDRLNNDPSNLRVLETKPQGPNRRKAQLEARIADLKAELENLDG